MPKNSQNPYLRTFQPKSTNLHVLESMNFLFPSSNYLLNKDKSPLLLSTNPKIPATVFRQSKREALIFTRDKAQEEKGRIQSTRNNSDRCKISVSMLHRENHSQPILSTAKISQGSCHRSIRSIKVMLTRKFKRRNKTSCPCWIWTVK